MNAPPDEFADAIPASERYDAGPGERLREARLTAKLSLQEVSTRLHLDVRTIERLESDDFGQLPAPTFVRGYLRNYARLLELPPDPIIEAFDRRGFGPPALIADIATHDETRSTDFWVVVVSIGIAVLVVTLAAVWFQTQRGDDLPLVQDTAGTALGEPSPSAAPADDDTAPAVAYRPSPAPEPAPMPAPAPEAAGPGSAAGAGSDTGAGPDAVTPAGPPERTASPGATDETAPAATSSAGVPGAGSGEPSSAPPPPAVPASESTEISTAPKVAVAAAAPAPPPLAAAPAASGPDATASAPGPAAGKPPVDTVSLHLAGDSWVEIYDANGERLYYNLAHQGQSIEVHGARPIRVLLGYADGVEVEYNGAPFDVSPFVSKGVARFELHP